MSDESEGLPLFPAPSRHRKGTGLRRGDIWYHSWQKCIEPLTAFS
ncbi:predicted protein [Plenodomus lingam JN3]|uniref:Predicted protein n=1 Tax=Leptosphaeria maculans (strain JN3 / isolate v23.1.3 / race Av1-4-5-6-7-8) TaxID=985895 RepID=E4ZYF3_LEPMJ|nr:predicted protein [Plenodomus lingam JN3]CBX96479.1 predicted protein [Plenodomus lingam JN3]